MMRVGLGFDVHPFGDGRPLFLCGVQIPYYRGLVGHSDADAALHAVMDALLGALSLGDIGTHFPNTDEAYRGADSGALTQRVVELIGSHGFVVNNVDITILAEAPKVMPHQQAMRNRLSDLLRCQPADVSVKATTMERLGFVGREEGIAAMAVATVRTSGNPRVELLTLDGPN